MKNLKKLTLLHSNDLHGDFLAEKVDDKLIGGVSRLSGYINKVRNEEKNVIYSISGDMFRGSLIDSEFQGLSTIEIMNLLAPDVVTIGNHEADYGLAHMLFIEKCASFPIINANMYIKFVGNRLFDSHFIKEIDGMKVLFIGILTEEVLANTKSEGLVGTLIDIQDAASEVSKICDAYRTDDIDLTVLLTHIGIEDDKKLAKALDPACGVDIIIGGHSHTLLSEPCVVAGIPIVQAAVGTDQIGRFDIMVDTDKNCIDSYTWQCIPVTEENCPRDKSLEKVVKEYKDYTDEKYGRVLTRFPRAYTHPKRNMETELGDLMAECMRDQLGADLVLLGSGSIRLPELGPVVTAKDFVEVFPFKGTVFGFRLTGKQLRHIVTFMLRDEAFEDDGAERCEWFQFSKGFFCEFDRKKHSIISLKMNGKEVEDKDVFTVAMQEFFFGNIGDFLDLPHEEIEKNGRPIEVATNAANVLEEYFKDHESLKYDGEKRLEIETPNRYNSRISAIGITVIEDGEITDSFFSYVDPETFFDPFNTQLTGIDEDTVAGAPAFPELWEQISGLMGSGILVAHNAPFDMGVLKKCLSYYDIYWKPAASYCCTVQIGRRLIPDISHKLNCMCDYYGISLDHHQADSDSRAAAEILLRYMKTGANIEDYVKLYRF